MSALWFDGNGARVAARSWTTWAEQLEVGARTLRLQLDSLAMAQLDGGAERLQATADELWTLAAFAHRVQTAVRRADSGGAVEADALWEDAYRVVLLAASARDHRADETARLRWLAWLDPDELRHELERDRDPLTVLADLPGDEALIYWKALTLTEQIAAARERPDVIAFQVLANGGRVAKQVVEMLDIANAHARFSESFALGLDVEVGLRVITLELGAGLSVVTTKLSDGSVELTLVEAARFGVGGGPRILRSGEVGASFGPFGELQQRFRFADEASAIEAIEALRLAARDDASFGELVRDVGGLGWNVATVPADTGVSIANRLIPFGDPIPDIPGYDLTPATVRELRELWLDHGLTRSEGGGARGDVSATLALDAGWIEAALDASVDQRTMFYDTDVAAADSTGARGQTGLMIAGTASIELDGEIAGEIVGWDREIAGHGVAETSYLLDLHRVDGDGTYLTVTVHTDVAAGRAMGLVDLGVAEIDVTRDRTATMTLAVTVPVVDATRGAVGEIGIGLARGHVPVHGLRELYDLAEVDVTVTTGTSTTDELGIDGGVIGVDASTTEVARTTQIALHKFPRGQLFARDEVDRLIEVAVD